MAGQSNNSTIGGRLGIAVGDPGTALPKGWRWTKLLDVAVLESGHTPSRREPDYWDGNIPWLGIVDARGNHGRVIYDTAQHVTPAGLKNSSARLLPKRTVCLSRTASVGYVVVLGEEMATSQDFVNWICSPAILPEFLMYSFLAEGRESLARFGRGTVHTTIYFKTVSAFHIALPPVAEQGRVVEALDDMLASVDRVEQTIQGLLSTVRQARGSLLDAALTGALVPQNPGDTSIAETIAEVVLPKRKDLVTSPDEIMSKKRHPASVAGIRAAVLDMPSDDFTFEQLREGLGGSYEKVRDALFSALDEQEAPLVQRFDAETGRMFLRRRK